MAQFPKSCFPTGCTALLAVLLGPSAALAQGVPKLDVAPTCRPLANNDFSLQIDTQRCLKTENEAREALVQQWSRFPAGDRSLCTQTASMGGAASYVQLLTCLELRRDAAAERAKSKVDALGAATGQPLTDRPAGLRDRAAD
jgi:hypothetical protein